MQTSLELLSPAKLNLFLHINYQRKDGYHELQTLFQLLDYGDRMEFSINGSGELRLLDTVAGVDLRENLIFRAATQLRAHAIAGGTIAELPGVDIRIDKRVPMGGGLGGGSSNAATTLLALNHLWQLNFPVDTLARLGMKLGADVPVFVHGNTAFAEGIGEQLTPISMPERWYLVVHPNQHISTPRVFSDKLLTRDTPKSKIAPALEGDLRTLADGHSIAVNDCTDVVCRLNPEVRQAMQWLSQYAPARLTGTGACIFASFTDKQRAEDAFSQMPTKYQGFVAKSTNKSPVCTRLSRV